MKTSYTKTALVVALLGLTACGGQSASTSGSGTVTPVNKLAMGEAILIQGQVLSVEGENIVMADNTAKINVDLNVALGKLKNPLKKGDIVRAKGFPEADGQFKAIAVGRSDGLVIEGGKITTPVSKKK